MRLGIFWQTPPSEGAPIPQRHWDIVDEIALAEEVGFETAWLAETPFEPPWAMSAPLMVAVAAAQRTEKIRVGTLATQTPLHHPLHIAMQSATCDILTNGRLDLCLGGRYGGPLFELTGKPFGIDVNTPLEESRERIAEGINLIRGAWTQDKVTFKGKYWDVVDLPVLPKPVQKPHPPIFLAANSNDTFQYAAKLGIGVVCTMVTQPVSNISGHLEKFNKSRIDQGQESHVALPFFVANSKEEALEVTKENWRDQDVVDGIKYIKAQGLDPDNPKALPGVVRWMTWDITKASELFIFDEPDACVDRLLQLQDYLPNMNQCILEFNRRGRIPSWRVQESMRLFAEKVLPKLNGAV